MEQVALARRDASNFIIEPEYSIKLEPNQRRVTVRFNDEVVADSTRAQTLLETRLSPVIYLPKQDARMDLLEPSQHVTHCPFKGDATYWHLVVGDKRVENAAWSYEDPLPEVSDIKGLIAFYTDKVDCFCEDEGEISLNADPARHEDSNPFVDWLVREAWEAATSEELAGRFARRLVEGGVPLWRMNLLVGTLNPLLMGTAYIWRRDKGEVDVRTLRHDRSNTPAFLNSPLVHIYRGLGGIRRRLDIADPRLDYPILKDLKEEGATDYVAMPLHFSDGQINVITLTSDRPGGFTTSDLGKIYEVLPVLSRFLEVQALRRTTRSLLDTYLGRHTGDLVLNGKIRRGDGENIPAVIFYCDLRDSTVLAEKLPREAYLTLLNDFLDSAAGAVLAQGGEVLKFIGDAVLAIFPVESCSIQTAKACKAALDATADVIQRVEKLNAERAEGGEEPLRFALALHLGEVTYGNVGAAQRLDFTVIGPAANEAARVAELCKELGHPVLATESMAQFLSDGLQTVGTHSLRGVSKPLELFALKLLGQKE